MEFEFVNDGEFGDPYYLITYDCEIGKIIYHVAEAAWYCMMLERFSYSADVFEEIANKLDDLNESLLEQRKEYFGLL